MRKALATSAVIASLLACGDNVSDLATLDDFLPELPVATGETQAAFAGRIAEGNAEELIAGPASSGVLGDYFMRNDKARFVIGAPTPLVGVVPSGGNLIDAVPLAGDGSDVAGDQYGETSVIYQLGRHCSHDSLEVLRDVSGGGVSVLRARGKTGYNEYVNIRGIGLLPIQNDLVPELPDDAECATTYVLEPGAATLRTYFTIFNAGDDVIDGPMGMLSDTGGEVAVFQPRSGFTRLSSVEDAFDAADLGTQYMVWQAPNVAYGILPRHDDPTTQNGSVVLLGVSVFIFGVEKFFDSLESDKNKFFSIASGQGYTFEVDIFAGRDAAEVEEEFQRLSGGSTVSLGGDVLWSDTQQGVTGARIGVFLDENGDGQVDDGDTIVSYADAQADGSWSASLLPGDYLVRAEVAGIARSDSQAVSTLSGSATASFALTQPIAYDFRIVDDGDADALIPARITVIGVDPVPTDFRTHGLFDSYSGIVTRVFAKRGTTTDVGDGADAQILLPPGGEYRIFVSRGTEWSIASQVVAPAVGDTPGELEFRLRRVVDTSGYIASEYHVHSIGSPDSPVPNDRRVATAVADGIELYATTDHDYIVQQQPIIERLGLTRLVRSISGIEISPMVYGHFNAWPVDFDATSPTGGAVEWPFGPGGYAMLPSEIFASARNKGAELLQVNHPRQGPDSSSDVTEYFDRIGLFYDYETRSIQADPLQMPVPTDWLRLPPEESLLDDSFNSLEVWNGFGVIDSNGDGVREISNLDTVMRDWFNFLSLGKDVTPIGSSDTHYEVLESMGMPRTMVRVTDDSANAIEEGAALVREVLDNLSRSGGTPTDVVLTDGPHLRITVAGDAQPLGKVHDGSSGSIAITIEVQSADWAQIDTIELFANDTPEVGGLDITTLQPFACFTSRLSLEPSTPCALAGLGGAGALVVNDVDLGGGFHRFESSLTLTVKPEDIVSREGATGSDAWIVVRVRGERAIYPLFIGNLLEDQDVSTFINGTPEQVDVALQGRGRPATAVSSAFFVDFDGGGYTAAFAP